MVKIMSDYNVNESDNENEEVMVTIEVDGGATIKCAVLTTFPVGNNDYIALTPIEGEAADNGEVYLYRYVELPDGEPSLDNIIDDDEYEAVADAFDELLDYYEYNEFFEKEDDEQ